MSYFYLDTKEFDKVATAIENFPTDLLQNRS